MESLKRPSYNSNSPKDGINRYPKLEKAKEVPKPDVNSEENEDDQTNIFPYIKTENCARLLPGYTSVLGRTEKIGVFVQDLDKLQHDIEKLLSFCAVRHTLLKVEVDASVDKPEVSGKGEKRGKTTTEKTSFKRKKLDDKTKYKDSKSSSRVLKTKCYTLPFNNLVNERQPKVFIPRNDTSEKFWTSIEPYCLDVTKDDSRFLDELIRDCSHQVDIKIPEVGEHYANEWTDSTISLEKHLGGIGKVGKTKSITTTHDLKKNGVSCILDTFSSPLTQRLLDTLIEEKVMKDIPKVYDKLKSNEFTLKATNGARSGACLDRRLRKELIEQGILDVDDIPKTYPVEDEIILEIRKCQDELSVVNDTNLTELRKLRNIVMNDLERQDVKAALSKVDTEVINMYNKILKTKQMNPSSFTRAHSICKEQMLLHTAYSELCDYSFLQ